MYSCGHVNKSCKFLLLHFFTCIYFISGLSVNSNISETLLKYSIKSCIDISVSWGTIAPKMVNTRKVRLWRIPFSTLLGWCEIVIGAKNYVAISSMLNWQFHWTWIVRRQYTNYFKLFILVSSIFYLLLWINSYLLSVCYLFSYFFATFKLNTYTKFRWTRQGSPWKPIRLMKRTIFKNSIFD